VISGGMTHSLNLKAMRLAHEKALAFTGGTDGHLLSDLGSVVTCARETTLESFLDAIAARRNLVVGCEKGPLQKLATGMVMIAKHSRYFLPGMAINYQQNAPRVRHYFRRVRNERNQERPK
jgi:hypothetical protein